MPLAWRKPNHFINSADPLLAADKSAQSAEAANCHRDPIISVGIWLAQRASEPAAIARMTPMNCKARFDAAPSV
jgi:hypothetical protein